MKSLVIFYSLEGNTKLIANTIAKTINADMLELKTKKNTLIRGLKSISGVAKMFCLMQNQNLKK